MKSPSHREFIRCLPCVVCRNDVTTECAHVRFADPRAAKEITGIGTKPSDVFTVPLCWDHHREQHAVGDERKFWRSVGIDPIFISLALWRISGDHEAGCQIITHARAWEAA